MLGYSSCGLCKLGRKHGAKGSHPSMACIRQSLLSCRTGLNTARALCQNSAGFAHTASHVHLCRNRHLTPSHPPHFLPSRRTHCGPQLTGICSPAPTSVTGTPATLTPTLGLLSKGPYNPTAVLPPKVTKNILDLEFVEMSEISLDDPPSHTPANLHCWHGHQSRTSRCGWRSFQ